MRVSQTVLEILDRCRTDGPNLFLPPGQLDRKDYEAVNKVLTAAGGKWTRKVQAHVFACDADEALDPILLTGEVTDAKREFEAFYTPPGLAHDVIRAAGIGPDMLVLEPNGGDGALVGPAIAAGAIVDAYEIRADAADELRDRFGNDCAVHTGDFLAIEPQDAKHDRVVMNPPFSRQADARHVLHAYRFLKPGGRLVAIMAASVTFRDTALYAEVRALAEHGDGSITSLPEGSFKESGTGVNTVLVVIDKPDLAGQDTQAAAALRSTV